MHYIDVGQGDSILVDWGETEILIDGGRYHDSLNYVQNYIDGHLEALAATPAGIVTSIVEAFAFILI